jgi:hypothetical protein
MPCTPFPPGFFPVPPSLPAGVSLAPFTPPTVTVGFCCEITVPPWGSFPFPPIPGFTPALLGPVVTLISTINAEIQAVFDAVAIPCPTE